MPNKAQKYGDKAVIEPVRVIEERKKIGLHPSCPVPVGAIMCYDTAFWQSVIYCQRKIGIRDTTAKKSWKA